MSLPEVMNVRCEYLVNPVGIGALRPRISWQLHAEGRGIVQTAYQLQVSAGDMIFADTIWDTGRVESDRSIHIKYGGPALSSRTRYFYRVRIWDNMGNVSDWSNAAYWETGILDTSEWTAGWIAPSLDMDESNRGQCPLLRKTFEVKGKVKAARIYATALGLYRLQLNGEKVGDTVLAPGWTSYNKRLQYQTYDVTGLLKDGVNAVGAMLGNGWYAGSITWHRKKIHGDKTAFLMQMHISYANGRQDIIASDMTWKASTGPILMSDIYDGEIYDARLEKDGWTTAAYDDCGWSQVSRIEHPKSILVAQENVPVRAIEEVRPVELIRTPAGETVIDMGQNMVGWVRFRVKGKPGDRVVLKHAEVLDRDGNFYTENLRKAKQTVEYTLKGGEYETYEPHFTFQGFRYVKLDEYPGTPDLADFTGVVVHSDMEPTGSFECSNELINQLQHNIVWGQKGNFVDVPTDCPQRDERLGWTGDAQVFARTACFNMNAAPFFTKWLRDLAADQLANGSVPYVIPDALQNQGGSAAWGDAAVICPWTVYLCYGDVRILEEQYDSMKSWVEFIRDQGENEYLWNTGFHFGDWVALDAKEGSYVGATCRDYIATAFYAYSTGILAKTAEVIGRLEDAKAYTELYEKIIENFRKEFVSSNGRLTSPTQTAHILALMFNLVEEKDKKRTIDTLARLVEENDNHLNTGFVGTPYLCHVLSGNGRNDIAYTLVNQKDYPSWLYPITKGATTIWEHWDGIKPDGSFWSADMNSFNHYAYGSVGDWLYRVMAGLDTDTERPGYKHFYVKPQPGQDISFVRASFKSMYGEIKTAWEKKAGMMTIEVTVPANTTATVTLPSAKLEDVREGGQPVSEAAGVSDVRMTDAGVSLELGSGTYVFEYRI